MRTFNVQQNQDLLRVLYERLMCKGLSARYVVAIMKVYNRVYSVTVDQMNGDLMERLEKIKQN